jgi:glutamyl-tRNA synthetase
MTPRLRLAVSPAGPLHVGTARIGLANWLLARRLGGQVTLRLDDTETARDITEPQDAIRHDLRWLGLDWDEEARQSERRQRYAAAADSLKSAGRLYPCFESETELNAKRVRRLRQGNPPIYDRAMLKLTPAQRAAAETGGKRPYWRFRLSDAAIAWDDFVLGRRQVDLRTLSDPVMIRADGTALAVFAGGVDDIEDGITHLVRGEDLTNVTAIQLDLGAAFGRDPAAIARAHLPALADAGGDRLSRRAGNFSLRALRQQGVEPDALAGMLACLGTAAEPRPLRPADLAGTDWLAGIAPGTPHFDMRRLLAVNRQALAQLPFAAVAGRLPPGATEAFWHAVRGSLDLLSEARLYWDVVAGTIVPPVIDGETEFLRIALETLPPEPWGSAVWTTWSDALKQSTGRAGKRLILPLRLALTGEDDGPALQALLPLIGRSRAAQRLVVAARPVQAGANE